jgi:thiaminase/transcriptional activator TenA
VSTLTEELLRIAGPMVRDVQEHPFWTGLADGGLAPESLAHFVAQDVHHLLPAYARALARAAASARADAHTALLGRSTSSTLEARDRLLKAYTDLAPQLGLPDLGCHRAMSPATRAHCATFTAATTISFAGGVGALLPMVWFNHRVADQQLERRSATSRYARWIELYHPGPTYRYAVDAFLAIVADIGQTATAGERRAVVDQFVAAADHELAFAESALRASRADAVC